MNHLRDATRWLGSAILAGCLCAPGWAEPPAKVLTRAEELYRAGDLLEAEPL